MNSEQKTDSGLPVGCITHAVNLIAILPESLIRLIDAKKHEFKVFCGVEPNTLFVGRDFEYNIFPSTFDGQFRYTRLEIMGLRAISINSKTTTVGLVYDPSIT